MHENPVPKRQLLRRREAHRVMKEKGSVEIMVFAIGAVPGGRMSGVRRMIENRDSANGTRQVAPRRPLAGWTIEDGSIRQHEPRRTPLGIAAKCQTAIAA